MSRFIQRLSVMFVLLLPIFTSAQEWVARYDGPGNGYDAANAIAVDSAGNIYVTGGSIGSGTFGDYTTIKYDTSGVEQWVARYNGPVDSGDFATAIAVDDAGNIYVTGRSYGAGMDEDYATVKYDYLGVEQWVERYNGPGNGDDGATAIAVDDMGNIYVTGGSIGSGTFNDYATIKYDTSGVQQWVERYDGPGNGDDGATAIAVDDMGNIYVTGYSVGSGTSWDYATVKYDSSGVQQWVVRYNNPYNGGDWARGIAVDDMGSIYVTGYSWGSDTNWDYATVQYDPNGIEQWVERYNGPGNGDDDATAIAVDNGGNIYVTGWSDGSGTYHDYATIKYAPTGLMEYKNTIVEKEAFMTTIFRGPLQLAAGKKCKVFDITGRVVAPDKIQPGIYFIEVDGMVTQKVVKVR